MVFGGDLDDEDGSTVGYERFGCDGEDFMQWDMKTLTWVAPAPQAVTTERRWDQITDWNPYLRNYLTKECADWLKKHLAYGESALQRTGRVT